MSNKLVKEKRVDQADLAWLTDPEVYEVNTIPPHSSSPSKARKNWRRASPV